MLPRAGNTGSLVNPFGGGTDTMSLPQKSVKPLCFELLPDGIARIALTREKYALVDASDLPILDGYAWHVYPSRHTWYASHSLSAGTTIFMHRFLMNAKERSEVDHINGNGLDNRRSNLRICTHVQNNHNRRKRLGTSSQYKGVWYYARYGTWRASIRVEGILKTIGRYANEEDAARAYDFAAKNHFGEFARLNFPFDELVNVQPLTRADNWKKRKAWRKKE